MSFYGNINCVSCNKETRFLIEDGEEILVIGHYTEKENEENLGQVYCDFCNVANNIAIKVKKNKIIGFKNSEGIINKTDVIQNGEVEKYYEIFQSDIDSHPLKKGDAWNINGVEYKVERIWTKENIETDTSKRLIEEIEEQFMYRLTSENGEKYATVKDLELNYLYYDADELEQDVTEIIDLDIEKEYNGILMDYLQINDEEEIIEITDAYIEREEVMNESMGSSYVVVNKIFTGYRAFIYDRDGILIYDVYKKSMQEIMDEIDEIVLEKTE